LETTVLVYEINHLQESVTSDRCIKVCRLLQPA